MSASGSLAGRGRHLACGHRVVTQPPRAGWAVATDAGETVAIERHDRMAHDDELTE